MQCKTLWIEVLWIQYTNLSFFFIQQCQGIVLATICGIESEYNWYYQACTKCAGRVKTVAGRLYCGTTKKPIVYIFDNQFVFVVHGVVCGLIYQNCTRHDWCTGIMLPLLKTWTTIVIIVLSFCVHFLFIISYNNYLRDVKQPNNSSDYPSDFDSFVGKQMLFEVEVSDGNILHNWRNYAVKRTTADEDVINRVAVFHNIKVY